VNRSMLNVTKSVIPYLNNNFNLNEMPHR